MILLPVLVYVVLFITLLTCYLVGDGLGHFHYGPVPPISALGNEWPEHGVFLAGFIVASVLLFFIMFVRNGMLDFVYGNNQNTGGSIANNLSLFIGVAGLFFICLMSIFPMEYWGWTIGTCHLAFAGIGFFLLAVYVIFSSAIAIQWNFKKDFPPDSHFYRKSVRMSLYISAIISTVIGLVLFSAWLIQLSQSPNAIDGVDNVLEWLGFVFLVLALIPTLFYFANYKSERYQHI
jgi:hypothetical protein